MILAGAWLVILGYGVLYSGVFKLAHLGGSVQCSLRDAFMGQCQAGGSSGSPSTKNTSLAATAPPQQQLPSLAQGPGPGGTF